jgi:hypothetical protein
MHDHRRPLQPEQARFGLVLDRLAGEDLGRIGTQ